MAQIFQYQLLDQMQKVSKMQHALQEWLLAYFRVFINEFLNKDTDIVPEEAPLILLDGKSDMYMANNGKDTKHTRKIAKIMDLVRNGEKCKMRKIDWCEGGLQFSDIATRNVVEHNLTPIMEYILVRL